MLHAVQEGQVVGPESRSAKNWNRSDATNDVIMTSVDMEDQDEADAEDLKHRHVCLRLWRYLKSTWSGVMTRQGIRKWFRKCDTLPVFFLALNFLMQFVSMEKLGFDCQIRFQQPNEHLLLCFTDFVPVQNYSDFIFFPEPILEDLDLPHRYRPENLNMLCEATG